MKSSSFNYFSFVFFSLITFNLSLFLPSRLSCLFLSVPFFALLLPFFSCTYQKLRMQSRRLSHSDHRRSVTPTAREKCPKKKPRAQEEKATQTYSDVDTGLWKEFASDSPLPSLAPIDASPRVNMCQSVFLSLVDVDVLSLCTPVHTPICHQSISHTSVDIRRSALSCGYCEARRGHTSSRERRGYYFHEREDDAKSQECKPIEYKTKDEI